MVFKLLINDSALDIRRHTHSPCAHNDKSCWQSGESLVMVFKLLINDSALDIRRHTHCRRHTRCPQQQILLAERWVVTVFSSFFNDSSQDIRRHTSCPCAYNNKPCWQSGESLVTVFKSCGLTSIVNGAMTANSLITMCKHLAWTSGLRGCGFEARFCP